MQAYLFVWIVISLVLVLAYRVATGHRGLNTPVGLKVEKVRSNSMADTMTYQVSAGTPVSGDVVSRFLTVVVNGVEYSSTEYVGPVTAFGSISVPQDSNVTVTLVDVDDAGNKSEPAVYTFVAADTVPPAQPGLLGVTLVGETHADRSTPVADVEVVEDGAGGEGGEY